MLVATFSLQNELSFVVASMVGSWSDARVADPKISPVEVHICSHHRSSSNAQISSTGPALSAEAEVAAAFVTAS